MPKSTFMRASLLLLLLFVALQSTAQKIYLPKNLSVNDSSLFKAMPVMAQEVIRYYKADNKKDYFDNLLRCQLAANQYQNAILSLDSSYYYYESKMPTANNTVNLQFRSYAIAHQAELSNKKPFIQTYTDTLAALFSRLPDDQKSIAAGYFTIDTNTLRKNLENILAKVAGQDSINLVQARTLVRAFNAWNVFKQIFQPGRAFFAKEDAKKYIIIDSLLLPMHDGGKLSAVIVRNRSIKGPQPVVLMYNIYAGPNDLSLAKTAADKGFVGMVMNTRGKKLSPDAIEPFEHDASDAYDAIDWISHQPWCNGKVGMYGGSYLGFSQWSATKKLHPSLKTIVPQVAVGIGGVDYPMFNNVFCSYMLRWIHYVTNDKLGDLADEVEFRDEERWHSLYTKWYESGRSFRALDTLDGRPQPIFQRWLDHPSFDAYWQNMVPYGKEFGNINIPILTTTGYFDDDQRGAFYYMQQHMKWNKNAIHYLLIGPWDHSGAQSMASRVVREYAIDSVANININETVFQWFNHILKDSPMPAMLKDRINYQVTGTNTWRSAPTLKALANDSLLLYLNNVKTKDGYQLLMQKPVKRGSILQQVSYTDRSPVELKEYPLLDSVLHKDERLVFITEPLKHELILNGSFEGNIKAILNKKDIDLYIELFELDEQHRYFKLSYTYGRASYAKDRSKRQLLQPGKEENLMVNNTYFMSHLLKKGSRIVVVMGMNKTPYHQLNYGTGKDVSSETIDDGKVPLLIEWLNGSYIKLPILKK